MSCNSLIDATDTLVYNMSCPYCGSTFEEDVMRETVPEEVWFEECISFEEKPTKIADVRKLV